MSLPVDERAPRPRPLVVFAFMVASLGVSPAWAQSSDASARPTTTGAEASAASASAPAANLASAERAFNQAVQRMDAGDYERACPLLEQSQSLDPSSGTLLNLGDCYEHLGRTASAWRAFADARALAASTSRPDRAQVADARVNRLAPTLRQLVIVPPSRPVTSFVVYLDDQALAASSLNAPVPVDGGVHRVRASAAGMREYAVEVSAPDAGTTTALQIPELELAIRAPAPPIPERASSTRLDGQQVAGIASGAVGLAAIATGTVFGLRSISKHQQSDDACHPGCSQEGVDRMNEARSAGNVSTVSFVIGGVGLGAAAVLWFARPFGNPDAASAGLGLAPGRVELRGTW